MSGTRSDVEGDLGTDAEDRARQGVEQAEVGNAGSVEQVEEARRSDPAGVEAVEQEGEDGPPGRGLSR